MTVAVLMPFASTEPWRVRARDHVTAFYRQLGLEVVQGGCEGLWRKAVAVDQAARHTSADVLVVADADCLCAGLADAVATVAAGAAWAIPHGLVHRLTEQATLDVYTGTPAAATTGRAQRPYQGFAGGGIVALRRDVWERVPMDPRFCGWGGEDSSWALALTTIVGPAVRFGHDLHHLWHPPAPKQLHRWGNPDSRALEIRYRRAARAGRRAMTDLLAETRVAV